MCPLDYQPERIQNAQREQPVYLGTLGSEHAALFERALARLLSTQTAEATYSEILDGLPTIDSFEDFHFGQEGHPVYSTNHASLCLGVVERTRDFRARFDPPELIFPAALGPDFLGQPYPPGL